MRNFVRDWHSDVSARIGDATATLGIVVAVGLVIVLTHPLGQWLLEESMRGAK